CGFGIREGSLGARRRSYASTNISRLSFLDDGSDHRGIRRRGRPLPPSSARHFLYFESYGDLDNSLGGDRSSILGTPFAGGRTLRRWCEGAVRCIRPCTDRGWSRPHIERARPSAGEANGRDFLPASSS